MSNSNGDHTLDVSVVEAGGTGTVLGVNKGGVTVAHEVIYGIVFKHVG